jgi:glutathione peroxidase
MNVHDFTVALPGGKSQSLSDYAGKVLLIVNTASKCGFTPQYKGLEELNRKYADKGLVVLGFPCNQFGSQEPGDEAEIQNFCSLTYDVSFPMAAKIDVNGSDADPLWTHLKSKQSGLLGSRGIKWNFTKFLVDGKGDVVGRYAPTVTPASLEKDIERLLG